MSIDFSYPHKRVCSRHFLSVTYALFLCQDERT
nr:MAG TPA: THAP domain-containing protein 11 FINGER, PROTEIN-DNA COMPLEX, DNA [Caudoviricetes sp.]